MENELRRGSQTAGKMWAFSARRTNSTTEDTLVFYITRLRQTLMVFSLVPKVEAICLLGLPTMT